MDESKETPWAIWKKRERHFRMMPADALWYDGFQCGQLNTTRIFQDDAEGMPQESEDRLSWLALHSGFVLGDLSRLRETDPKRVADVQGQIASFLPEQVLAEELQGRLAALIGKPHPLLDVRAAYERWAREARPWLLEPATNDSERLLNLMTWESWKACAALRDSLGEVE